MIKNIYTPAVKGTYVDPKKAIVKKDVNPKVLAKEWL